MPRKGKKKPSQPPPRRPDPNEVLPGEVEEASRGGAQEPPPPKAPAAVAASSPEIAAAADITTAAMKGLKIDEASKEKQEKMPLRENVQVQKPWGGIGRGRGQPPPTMAPKVPGTQVASTIYQQEPQPSGLAQKLNKPISKDLPKEAAAPAAIEVKLPPPTSCIGVPRPDCSVDQGAPGLWANLFPLNITLKEVYHYDVEITRLVPDKDSNFKGPKIARPLPSTLTRPIFEEAVKNNGNFFFTNPVYDGNRNAYTKAPLALNMGNIKVITISYTEVIGTCQRTGDFTLKIQPAELQREYKEFLKHNKRNKVKSNAQHVIDLEMIKDFYEGKSIKQIPQECLAAIGTILRHSPSLSTTPVRHGFYTSEMCRELPDGLELWFGYNFNVHVGRDQLYLNLDRGLTPFYTPGPLVNFVSRLLRSRPLQTLGPNNFRGVGKKLEKIKIYLEHLKQGRLCTIWRISDKDCNNQTFEKDGRKISVAKYYYDEYKIKLKYPNLPTVNCGSPGRDTFYPMELCYICDRQPHYGDISKEQQSKIISFSALEPQKRFKIIGDSLRSMKATSRKTLDYFGIQIGENMLKVAGPVLKPPQLQFKDKVARPDDRGSWNAFGFYQGGILERWILISFVDLEEINEFVKNIINIGSSFNMRIKPPVMKRANDSEDNVRKVLQECKELEVAKCKKGDKVQLLFIVLSDRINKAFLKYLGEYEINMPTVCARWTNVAKSFSNRMFIGNLLLKMNLKLNGTNYKLASATTPSLLKNDSIIIGINVTHKGPRNKSMSYAAVVANMDIDFNLYEEEVVAHKSLANILSTLRTKLKSLFEQYAQRVKKIPKQVIVFRDGVGDGQYPEVKQNELPIIKEAYSLAYPNAPNPRITLAVGLRRNSLRFMPINPATGARNGNILPGTLVDKVSNPYEFEFYLCSHFGIKGTSAPTKYSMLHDDNKLKTKDFADLIFSLAHLYTRCTRSISTPSVMRSAQHYALRGKDSQIWMVCEDEHEDDEGQGGF